MAIVIPPNIPTTYISVVIIYSSTKEAHIIEFVAMAVKDVVNHSDRCYGA